MNQRSSPEDRRAARDEAYASFAPGSIWRRRARRAQAWLLVSVTAVLRALRRPLDALLALMLLALAAPILVSVPLTLLLLRSDASIWRREVRMGRLCEPFQRLSFDLGDGRLGRALTRLGVDRWPVLLNIVRGDMAWVGPRAVAPGELTPNDRLTRRRYDLRPGLVSPWWIRQRANIDYGTEAEADFEYVARHSLGQDVGVALRAVPTLLYGGRDVALAYPGRIAILGARMDNLTMGEAIEAIVARLDSGPRSQVCFINADCLNLAYRMPDYLATLNQSWLSLADGIGLKLAGRLLRQPVKQNVNGTDLFPRLCEALAGTGHRVFLLGARPGVAEAVSAWMAQHFPGVTVAGTQHGYFEADELPDVVERIRTAGTDLLLVAFGAPRQDLWLATHLADTGASVGMGVGGLFDFYSGRTPRAPLWMRELGLEWLYRLTREPGRLWRRYVVGNGVFLARVVRSRLTDHDPSAPTSGR